MEGMGSSLSSPSVFDGGGTAEPAVRFDADDGAVTFEMNPIAPRFFFVAWLEILLAEGGEDFGDRAGCFFF